MTKEEEILCNLLFKKYGKITLNAKETASVISELSDKSLEKDRAEAIGIPYTKRNNKEKGAVLYNITAIVRTLLGNERKTI